MIPAVSCAERAGAIRHAQRAGGQVAALAGMVAAGAPFADIAQQLLAARGSLDSLLVRLIDLELTERFPTNDVRDEVDNLIWLVIRHSGSRQSAFRRPHARPQQLALERTHP